MSSEDLTRKQRREEARDQRQAAQQAAQAQGARRRRLIQLAAALAAAVAAVVVVIVISSTGGASAKKGILAPKQAAPTLTAVSSEIGGIPQSGSYLGSPKAPVTVQYFSDLECPICQTFTLQDLPAFIAKYVRTGKVRVQYRSFQTATRDPATFSNQQVAALAAGRQNHLWDYVELFYHEQGQEGSGYVTESYLQGLARQVPGLNLATWNKDRGMSALTQQVGGDANTAAQDKLTGTPALIGVGPRKALLDPNFTYSSLVALVAAVS